MEGVHCIGALPLIEFLVNFYGVLCWEPVSNWIGKKVDRGPTKDSPKVTDATTELQLRKKALKRDLARLKR
jgi:hypothetical protein